MNLRNAINSICKSSLALILALSGSFIPLCQIQAVSGDGLIAYPATSDPDNPLTESWFIYSLDRGEKKDDALIIKNESDQAQSISIYAVDSTANNLGDFALESADEPKDGVGKWIKLETDRLQIAPREEKQVKFSISIPDDAQSGENAGGIIIQKDLTEAQKNTKSGFVISTRIGIRVYETVPGELIYKASFGNAAISYDEKDRVYVLTLPVKNEGSSSIETTVRIHAKDKYFGKQNKALEKTMRIPRGEEAKYVFTLDEAQIGEFDVSSELTYKKNDGSFETMAGPNVTFWAFPWEYLPLLGLLLLANIIFIIILKLLRRRDRKYRKTYRIQNGDNLENLAERLHVGWKKIAKMNKLKAPYQLEVGQEIKVIDRHGVLDDSPLHKEPLAEPDENARQSKQAAFEKDMDLIAENGDSEQKKDSSVKKLIGSMIILLIIAGAGYALLSRLPDNSQTDFVYDRSEKQAEENKDPQTESTKPEEAEEEAIPETAQAAPAGETTENSTPAGLTIEDRQSAQIEILNGNGTKGVSAQAAALLKEKGYSAITTGNADRFDYSSTVIECGSDLKQEICQEIGSIISVRYPSTETKEGIGANASKITITLGQ